LLEIRDIALRFGGIVALDGVSFAIEEGQILGLIGPNGAGKTTLFNCVSRLYTPNRGNILFEGNRFNGDVAPALADLQDSGTVRIIDLAFVRKETDGAVSFVEAGDPDLAEELTGIEDGQFDLLNDEDLIEVASGLDAGSSAMIIVWENSWAARLGAAVRASHGRLIALERIPHETVQRAVAALDEE
jgi:ABC-type cobalamin/Fe3+-siderophores transport system ATPase subunit